MWSSIRHCKALGLPRPLLSCSAHCLPHVVGTKRLLSTDSVLGNILCLVFTAIPTTPLGGHCHQPTLTIKKQGVALDQKFAQGNTAGDTALPCPFHHIRRSPVLLKILPPGHLTRMPSMLPTVVWVRLTFSNLAFGGLPLPTTKLCFISLTSILYDSHLLSCLSWYVQPASEP